LGSAQKATERVKELQEYAAKTPFRLDEISKGDLILQNFGIRSEKTLDIIGKSAFVTGSGFSDLSMILGQLSQSKDLENIRQLVERGVVGFNELKDAGIRFAKDGSIINSVDETFGVILAIMEKKYGNAKLDTTLGSQISTLLDNIDQTAGAWAKNSGVYDAATKALSQVNSSLSGMGEWFSSNGGTIINILTVLGGAFVGLGVALAIYNIVQLGATLGAVGLVPSLWAIAGGVWAIMAPLLPFIALGALVGAMLVALKSAFDNNTFGIRDMLLPILDQLGKIFNDWVMPSVREAGNALMELWNVVQPILMPVLQVLAFILGTIIVAAILILMGVIKALAMGVSWMANEMKIKIEQARQVWDWLSDGARRSFDSIQSGARGMANQVIDSINKIIKGYNGIAGAVNMPTIKPIDRFSVGGEIAAGQAGYVHKGEQLIMGPAMVNNPARSGKSIFGEGGILGIKIEGPFLGTARDRRRFLEELDSEIDQMLIRKGLKPV
jgi:hypothetical protein